MGITLISTGGTADYIHVKGYAVTKVEDLTGYPGILGGRVKTLHPKVFGGILARRNHAGDSAELAQYEIPPIDLVIVDLYPFGETVAPGAPESEVIEKIDVGGIALIRAAAKNFRDIFIVPSRDYYPEVTEILRSGEGTTTLEQRKRFAAYAFAVSSGYDTAIYNYFGGTEPDFLRIAEGPAQALRYGENPHQQGFFYGNLHEMFEKLHGKEISYNNLLDIDAAVRLIDDFTDLTFAILKHNNACGLACRDTLMEAWKDTLAGDPVSAFGGILVTNVPVDAETAGEINKLFYEILMAPSFHADALELLKQKKNRILLQRKPVTLPNTQVRSLLHGMLSQGRDCITEAPTDLKVVTREYPAPDMIGDLLFANILVKHTKSNAIVLAKNRQLIASGTGQTSRIDALKQAIEKAQTFGFDLNGAVMASDAFFPFADSVEIAFHAGIKGVIQPGGSARDQDSIDFCNEHGLPMIFTGIRHFKH